MQDFFQLGLVAISTPFVLLWLFFACFKGKKYQKYTDSSFAKEFQMSELLCVGFSVMRILHISTKTRAAQAKIREIAEIKGKKYGFDTETYQMLYGFVKINGNYYYFDEETGVMLKGWQKINGKYRYFSKKNGKMQKSKRIGKHYVKSKGIRTKKK